MTCRVEVLLFYDKPNRGSLNSLCGAFEQAGLGETASLHLVREREEFVARVMGRVDAPTLACISFATPQYWATCELVAAMANRPAATLLVAGGPHPTAMPNQTRAMGFDIVVAGAGEQAFVDLVREMAAPCHRALQTLPGFGVGIGIGIVRLGDSCPGLQQSPDPQAPVPNPFPSVSPAIGAVGPVEITRGCPFCCGYCQTPRIFPGPIQHRSVESIARQLAAQRAERLRDFRFVAPNAFGYGAPPGRTDPAAVETLLTEAKAAVKGGRLFFGTFPSEVRPESVLPEMLELVRRFAHNDNLTLGLQTGSERLLSTIGRGHTVAQVVAAVELANRAGFGMNVDVIFGMPDETEEDVSETLRVMLELIGLGARIHAHSYLPLPGTPWWPRPPAPTPPTLDAALNRLIPTGRLFGHWLVQRKLAARILQDLAHLEVR